MLAAVEDLKEEWKKTGVLKTGEEEPEEEAPAEEPEEEIAEQTEPYQRKVKAKHKRMKIRLIGKGGGKHVASSYTKKPSYKRSKSAPPSG